MLLFNPLVLLSVVSTHGIPRRISKKGSIISNRQVNLKVKRTMPSLVRVRLLAPGPCPQHQCTEKSSLAMASASAAWPGAPTTELQVLAYSTLLH